MEPWCWPLRPSSSSRSSSCSTDSCGSLLHSSRPLIRTPAARSRRRRPPSIDGGALARHTRRNAASQDFVMSYDRSPVFPLRMCLAWHTACTYDSKKRFNFGRRPRCAEPLLTARRSVPTRGRVREVVASGPWRRWPWQRLRRSRLLPPPAPSFWACPWEARAEPSLRKHRCGSRSAHPRPRSTTARTGHASARRRHTGSRRGTGPGSTPGTRAGTRSGIRGGTRRPAIPSSAATGGQRTTGTVLLTPTSLHPTVPGRTGTATVCPRAGEAAGRSGSTSRSVHGGEVPATHAITMRPPTAPVRHGTAGDGHPDGSSPSSSS